MGSTGRRGAGQRVVLPELASGPPVPGLRGRRFGDQPDAAPVVDVDAGSVLRRHAGGGPAARRCAARAVPPRRRLRESDGHPRDRRRRDPRRGTGVLRVGDLPARDQSAVQLLRHRRPVVGTAGRRPACGVDAASGSAATDSDAARDRRAGPDRHLRLVDRRCRRVSRRLGTRSRRGDAPADLGRRTPDRDAGHRAHPDEPGAGPSASGVAGVHRLCAVPVALAAAHLLSELALSGRRVLAGRHRDPRRIGGVGLGDNTFRRGATAVRSRVVEVASACADRWADRGDGGERGHHHRLAARRGQRHRQHRESRSAPVSGSPRLPLRRARPQPAAAAEPRPRTQGLADHLGGLGHRPVHRRPGSHPVGYVRRSDRHPHHRPCRRFPCRSVDRRPQRHRAASPLQDQDLSTRGLRADHHARVHVVRPQVPGVQ